MKQQVMMFRFDVQPARASSNRRHSASRTDKGLGRRMYQATLDELTLSVLQQRHRHLWSTLRGKISVRMTTFIADERGVDVDAAVKCVLDALQAGKAIANDKQVSELIALRVVKGQPRIEVEIRSLVEESDER